MSLIINFAVYVWSFSDSEKPLSNIDACIFISFVDMFIFSFALKIKF